MVNIVGSIPTAPTQTSFHAEDPETGNCLSVRTIFPSEPRGVWIGNKRTMREWTFYERGGRPVYRKCTPEEIIEFERLLGEWENFDIIEHNAIGLVSVESIIKRLEEKNETALIRH